MRDYILRKVAESHNGWARAKMCSEAQKGLTRATAWSESDWSNSNEGVGKETVLMTSSVVALCWCVWLVWALQGLGLSDAKGTHLLSYNCIFRDFMWSWSLGGTSSQLFPLTDGTRWFCPSILHIWPTQSRLIGTKKPLCWAWAVQLPVNKQLNYMI